LQLDFHHVPKTPRRGRGQVVSGPAGLLDSWPRNSRNWESVTAMYQLSQGTCRYQAWIEVRNKIGRVCTTGDPGLYVTGYSLRVRTYIHTYIHHTCRLQYNHDVGRGQKGEGYGNQSGKKRTCFRIRLGVGREVACSVMWI